MSQRKDVVAPRKYTQNGEEKTAWTKIGVVFIDGDKMNLRLESVPIGWDGFALISDPKQKDDAPKKPVASSGQSNQGGGMGGDFDDDIPF
jgi:hypothetical protein